MESDIVKFVEYSDDALPAGLKWQILSFLRIVFPDGFVGADRYRDQITQPKYRPHHLLYVANDLVVSHVEVVHRQIEHAGATYRACAPTGVLTFPSFRREGWGGKLVRLAADRIEASGVDLGLICCAPQECWLLRVELWLGAGSGRSNRRRRDQKRRRANCAGAGGGVLYRESTTRPRDVRTIAVMGRRRTLAVTRGQCVGSYNGRCGPVRG